MEKVRANSHMVRALSKHIFDRKYAVAAMGFILVFSSLIAVVDDYWPPDEMLDSPVDSIAGESEWATTPGEPTNGWVENRGNSIDGYESTMGSSSTFRMATVGSPTTLDPSVAYDARSWEVLQNVYETLVWYNRDDPNDLIPMLATEVPTIENGGISLDGLTYTFHIREGIYFHDSSLLNGYDVEYSIERVLTMNDPSGPVWMLAQVLYPSWPGPGEILDPSTVDSIVTVNPSDPFEVSINLISPYAGFLQILATPVASIVSMEYVEAHGGVEPVTQNEWMNVHEAGTGPFSLSEFNETNVILNRYADYWGGEASIGQVIILNVESAEERKQMLIDGTVDSAYIPREMRSEIVSVPELRIVEGWPTFNMEFMGFNQEMSMELDVGSVPADFFADTNVRRAFVHAFDYEQYLGLAYQYCAIQPNGPVPLGMFGYSSEVPNYNLDKALAAEFLSKTDYATTGFNIILYYSAGNNIRELECFILKEGLETIPIAGEINVQVQALDWSTYINALYHFSLPLYFLGWIPDYADPDDYVNPFLHSDGVYPYFLSLSNTTLDTMINNAATELDQVLREDMYSDISWACYENGYYIWTAQDTNFHVERDWVTGYYFNPMHAGLYYYHLGLPGGPSEPQNFNLQAELNRITLNWDPPLDTGGYALVGYKVYKGDSPSSLAVIAELGVSTTTWNDYEIVDGETLYYAVSAVNEISEGEMSEILSIVAPGSPTPPRSLLAESQSGKVGLSWIEPTWNGTLGVECYNIYRGTSIGEESIVDTIVGTSLQYIDHNVTVGETYYYHITAENGKGESPPSNEQVARPLLTVDHAPFRINSDAELISMASLEEWPGDGTESDPYLISGLSIDAEMGPSAIFIGNVTLHFEIEGCILMNSSWYSEPYHPGAAIAIINSSNGIVCNNVLDVCPYGLFIENSTDIIVHENLMTPNTFCEICIMRSIEISLTNNTMMCYEYGIIISNSDQLNLEFNSIIGTLDVSVGIVTYWVNNSMAKNNYIQTPQGGILMMYSANVSIISNLMMNCYIGIGFQLSVNMSIESNCIVGGTGIGMIIDQSSDTTIFNNTCSDGFGGIFLYYADNNILEENNCSGNEFLALEMYESEYNSVINNTFADNLEYGVGVFGGGSNTFFGNVFKRNNGASEHYSADHIQAYDDTSTDVWYSSEWHGNYWSDWTTPDADLDGIVDVPYAIDGGSLVDLYPLSNEPPLPQIRILEPDEGSFFNTTTITIQWIGESVYAEIDHYEITVDDGEWIDVGLNTSYELSSLSEGEHEVRVKVIDSDNATAIATVHFIVDLANPNISILEPIDDAFVDQNNVQVSWTGDDALSGIDHYEVRMDGGEWVDFGTNTSLITEPLSEGWHIVDVRAFDKASNHISDSVSFMVDTIDPSVQIANPSSEEIILSTSLDVDWEGSDEGSGISSFSISIDGSDWIDMGLNTSYHIASIDEGTHEVRVRLTDNAGNEAIDIVSFYVDVSDPTLTITAPLEGALLNSSDVTVKWSGQDAGSGIDHYELRVDSTSWENVGLSTTFIVPGLSEGAHSVDIKAYDNAGYFTSESVSFMVDTEAPALDVTAPSDGQVFNQSSVLVTWTVADLTSGVVAVELSLDGGGWIDVTSSDSYQITSLSEGDHTVVVRACDGAGNSVSVTISFKTDTSPPSVSFIQPLEGDYLNSSDFVVMWTMTDQTSEIDYCEVRVDGNGWIDMGLNISFALSGLEDGNHTFEVIAHDLVGNSAEATVSFLVDTLAPVTDSVWMEAEEDWASFSWEGSDEGSGIDHWEVRLDDGDWQEFGLSTSINFTSLSEGLHNFSVRAVDKAGNAGDAKVEEWIVDTISPTIISCSPEGSGVATDTQIVFTFSEDVLSCGVTILPGNIETSVECSGSSVVITLAEELERATTYQVSINASDLHENCLEYEWLFSTIDEALIYGIVIDGDGSPIQGCDITIDDQVISCTNSSGCFQCEIVAGDYTIRMHKEGFEDASFSVSVTEGEVLDLGEVQLSEEGEGGDETLILIGAGIAIAVVALALVAIYRKR